VAVPPSRVTIDPATGSLIVGGNKLFPIGLSNGPPPESTTPAGRNGLEEVAANGVSFVRTGIGGWSRRTPTHLYLIAVRASGSVTRVAFSGLPRTIRRGEVLFEHVQEPLPPPVNRRQVPRRVIVTDGSFSDWFAPHDAHVYRFAI
jgi:hypothetical protein